MIDILLTDAYGECGRVVQDSLRSHGLRVETLQGPSARRDEPGFVRALKATIAVEHPRAVIPVFYPEVVSRHRSELPSVEVYADSADKLMLLDDKVRACELAESLCIPQPRRYKDPSAVDHYPVVFKRPLGQSGDSVYFPRTEQALQSLISTARGRYLITDYIEGRVYCVDALRLRGYFRAISYRVLEPIGKGVSTSRQIVDMPQIIEYVRRMLDSVDYMGPCGADFIVDAQGRAYFLELNPRFCGGISSAIESGFDIPYLYYTLFGPCMPL